MAMPQGLTPNAFSEAMDTALRGEREKGGVGRKSLNCERKGSETVLEREGGLLPRMKQTNAHFREPLRDVLVPAKAAGHEGLPWNPPPGKLGST